jgi:hypothetical protein
MTDSAFFWGDETPNLSDNTPESPTDNQPGHDVVTGSEVQSSTAPSFLATIHRGSGQVVISELRVVEHPIPRSLRTMSALLSNLGAQLISPAVQSRNDAALFNFYPIDLAPYVNLPFKDETNGPHGWHGGGPDNDMRSLPVGLQTFHGVQYKITDPATANGNGAITLKCTYGPATAPRQVLGIAVNCKADRLYFLHSSAWGVPGFTYRVYYAEDRKNWIFGKPDPFVDVVVKPGENIQDWFSARGIEDGSIFASGLTVAWSGENPYAHRNGSRIGLYQMVWDNPHPEKTIGSIDILSPGTTGSGQIFVVGITAARRK